MKTKNTNFQFRGARAASGHTQSTLAASIGVTPATVFNWESGHTKPKPKDMLKLADELKVPVENIVRMFA